MDTKKLKQKILDLAIRGKLVPQDPTDEPASVLMERIRAEKEQLIKDKKIKRDKNESHIFRSGKSYYEKRGLETVCIDNEIPFQIPESWVWCRLINLCSFISRGKSPKYSEENKIPVFAQKCNLKDGGISLDQARFLDPNTIGKWSEEYKLKTDDILVNSTGTGTVCRTRLFNEQFLGKYPFVVPDSHVSVVRTFSDIKSQYIYAYLSSNIAQQYLEDNLAGSTNQKELYIGVLKSLIIPMPSLNEQQRIADCIDSINVIINKVDIDRVELLKILKQTKAKVLDLAIRGKLVPQDPADEPASVLLERIKAEKKATGKSSKRGTKTASTTSDNSHYPYEIPDSWIWTNIGNVTRVVSAKRVLKNEWKDSGIPFYRAREIVKLSESDRVNNDLFITESHYKDLSSIYGVPQEGDIMISAVGTIGKTYIVKNTDVFYYKDASVLCIHSSLAFNSMYLQKLIDSEFFKMQMFENSKGTTVDTITIEKANAYMVSIPPLNEQKRIVAKVDEIFEQLDNIEKALMVE